MSMLYRENYTKKASFFSTIFSIHKLYRVSIIYSRTGCKTIKINGRNPYIVWEIKGRKLHTMYQKCSMANSGNIFTYIW